MADHLSLSLWLRRPSLIALPTHFRKVVSLFPFSRLNPACVVRVHALSFQEPPVFERILDEPPEPAGLEAAANEFLHEDSGYQLECFWDLWRWDGDWSLAPSNVIIEVYAPEFDSPQGETIRIDAGPETLFLPPASETMSGMLRPVESNLRSLVHLTHELEGVLPVDRRALWSDSGEDFAARLQSSL